MQKARRVILFLSARRLRIFIGMESTMIGQQFSHALDEACFLLYGGAFVGNLDIYIWHKWAAR